MEKFNQRRNLNVRPSIFNTGDKTFFGSYLFGKLLLCQTGPCALSLQLLSNDKRITFHVVCVTFSRTRYSEVLSNQLLDRS